MNTGYLPGNLLATLTLQVVSSEASSWKRLHTFKRKYMGIATDGGQVDGENLGDCLEDELNIKVLEDVEEELVGQAVQAEVRAVIHLHHRLG